MPTYAAPGVYVEEVPSSQKSLSAAATAIAAFVGFTAKAPSDDPADPEGLQPRLVTSWTQFEQLYGGFAKGCMLPLSVYGYFQNGGNIAYIVRVPNTVPAGEPSQLALPAADRALGTPLEITSIEPDAELSVAVEPVDSGEDQEGPAPFDLVIIEGGREVERFPSVTLTPGDDNVEKQVNGVSTKVKVKVLLDKGMDLSNAVDILKPGVFSLEKAPPKPVPVTGKKFSGSETARTGINGLSIADEVTMVVVPDLVTAATKEDGTLDLGLWKAVQTALIGHCELQGNRMAVLDSPPGMTVQQIKEWRSDVAMYDTQFAAFYYPWIKVENPAGTNGDREMYVPPSGHVAGVWARTDETRGVWKAPANDTIRGCLDIERPITKNEQSLLNPIGINCIRPFGTRGIRIWGARTLSSDSDWRYINVRRLFNMVETTILDGTQWAVFEPNDVKLWEGVSRTLTAFLNSLWTAGALFGATPDQAYYVKCDAETNPPESIDEGRLIVEVGLAPVKPAEFVIFRVSQQKQVAG
ncbi:phage tail sheath subtilisin-like domain-containing protein [Acidiferrimicrobium sp. IK]|uniref:phage tail sheath family protein n=1 Tax=Acidiferrimicrobium sp. IK TaxID=2871700 RepID=UPI0021CB0FD7|nr:phage tail sheath subtilisin-like domain-containing protein [Acidiferrimicrobium sp. IK]MCU4186041.1 phage tail sheath subtilisin-like domain-containing protein [Acidiferrimicrobium sp. IK]